MKIYSPQDFPTYLPKLGQLYDDLFSGGKGFRGQLIRMVSDPLQIPQRTQDLLVQTVEFIHNSSLLHDDLIDRSVLRRGKSAAWVKYSPEYAVLAGDYLLARVMVNLSGYGNIHLVRFTAEVISELLEGEWLQDTLKGDFDIDLEALDRIHRLKTASLFRWCLRAPLMTLPEQSDEVFETLNQMGSLLGQLFQRADDLLDFDIRNEEGKALLGDMKAGYLNSFAAFACEKKKMFDRKPLKNVQGLDDFYRFLGGELEFRKCVEDFDLENQNRINAFEHYVKDLGTRLVAKKIVRSEEHAEKLISQLLPLGRYLYWRKKA